MWCNVAYIRSVDMARWLMEGAVVGVYGDVADLIGVWPETTAPGMHSAQLLEVVRITGDSLAY